MRTIIVGDIHGCYKELKQLLKDASFNSENDYIVSLGDLMDRGNESYDVLRFFQELKEVMEDRCTIIRGNHEQLLINAAASADVGDIELWIQNGGIATIASFRKNGKDAFQCQQWLEENTVLYHIGNGYQCVHAGLADEDPKDNPAEMLLWDRRVLELNLYSGRLTIVGHTPLKNAVYCNGLSIRYPAQQIPYNKPCELPETGLICLDTGCVFGNKLTAMVLEDDEPETGKAGIRRKKKRMFRLYAAERT